jgi:hypothetical protein
VTKKETLHLRKLEIENAMLREQHTKHMQVYRDQTLELIELRAKLQLCKDVLNEDHDEKQTGLL